MPPVMHASVSASPPNEMALIGMHQYDPETIRRQSDHRRTLPAKRNAGPQGPQKREERLAGGLGSSLNAGQSLAASTRRPTRRECGQYARPPPRPTHSAEYGSTRNGGERHAEEGMHLAPELPGKGLYEAARDATNRLPAPTSRRPQPAYRSLAIQRRRTGKRPGSKREVSLMALRASRTGNRQATGDDCRGGGGASRDLKAGHVASVGHRKSFSGRDGRKDGITLARRQCLAIPGHVRRSRLATRLEDWRRHAGVDQRCCKNP